MNNKIVIAVAVAVVVVVGGIGAAYVLFSDDETTVTYHGNGYKTINGEETISSIVGDTAMGNVFISDMELYNWNTKADGSGTYVEIGEKIPSGVDDLYAQWVNVIHFTHNTSLNDHYKNISISTKTTVQGTVLNKTLERQYGFGYSYNGTGTEITFTTSENVDNVCVDGSNVLFCYEDGSFASMKNVLEGLSVVESHVSGKSAIVTVSEKTNGDVKIHDEELQYSLTLSSMEGVHFEYYSEDLDNPVVVNSGDTVPIFSEKQSYLRLVIDAENSEVFATTYGKSLSYRIDGVNQPTIYYKASGDGYISNGETKSIGGGHYENYLEFEIYPDISLQVFSFYTGIVIELSSTPFE